MSVRAMRSAIFVAALAFLVAIVLVVPLYPSPVSADVTNPLCPTEIVHFNPSNGQDIVVPTGFKVSVFKSGLNGPTGIAFLGNAKSFQVFVLESGHGLPSQCNEQGSFPGGTFTNNNPFTPDILVFDQNGMLLRGPLGKPTAAGGGFQPAGPAIDIAFENGSKGGRLFATDSNQSIHGNGQNNSSRIVIVDPDTGKVTPFITGLPTGDHPAEMFAFKDGWIYWSQGSTTNSGVVGRDNNNGNNQQDIPCQQITLSQNVFNSGGGVTTSGYSPFGVHRPGATVDAFESATGRGICDGAVLRAKLNAANPKATIEPFSWGYRNPYGIRFAPKNHALQGNLFVTENGEDERGARPANNAPDRLQIAKQNSDGSPDYHGWPDRFGFLDSTQAVFNPVGGPGDDNQAAVVGKPVQPVLAFPPQPITSPVGIEPADVALVGVDFVPKAFAVGVVKPGAALIGREGDFGFSAGNGSPEAGHDVELVNFSRPNDPLQIQTSVFARNTTFEQAFPDGIRGINRPTNLRFGPDGCAYLVDYGAVRDFGQSDAATKFITPADGPLVQFPGTGVIWRICGPVVGVEPEDDD